MSDVQVITVTVIILAAVAGMAIGIIRFVKHSVDDFDYSDWNDHV